MVWGWLSLQIVPTTCWQLWVKAENLKLHLLFADRMCRSTWRKWNRFTITVLVSVLEASLSHFWILIMYVFFLPLVFFVLSFIYSANTTALTCRIQLVVTITSWHFQWLVCFYNFFIVDFHMISNAIFSNLSGKNDLCGTCMAMRFDEKVLVGRCRFLMFASNFMVAMEYNL